MLTVTNLEVPSYQDTNRFIWRTSPRSEFCVWGILNVLARVELPRPLLVK